MAVRDYESRVYAGVLGKVIGVYMGRPFEGWTQEALENRWGRIEGYVHEDQNVPLVVPDDDITGTFTFVRALEDSGQYADTPASFFGETWLNYLVEGKTVLWWGGMGHSTEHTAYLRLKSGIPSPESGSIERNGPTVAQQIGAQIFIDAFGLVTPGKPELAARLARAAAGVSHDGEAVHAAVAVAAMVSAAFVEQDMDALLDLGVRFIPEKSLISKVHRDVRAWSAQDGDWRRTYERIEKRYGYQKFGGNCHVVPNHALMVLAWAYAPDDFYEAQAIVNTAGWDTDCNAGNVGCLMGVKVGLGRICERYDFRSPFADRVILPTSEGTRSMSDCLLEAQALSRTGRILLGWAPREAPKKDAYLHFEMPGALQGVMREEAPFSCRDRVQLKNVRGRSLLGKRSLQISFQTGPGTQARIARPVLPPIAQQGGYGIMGTPRIYSGMVVRTSGSGGKGATGAMLRLYVRVLKEEGREELLFSKSIALREDQSFQLRWKLPDTGGRPIQDLGMEITSSEPVEGKVFWDALWIQGAPELAFPLEVFRPVKGTVPGWISHYDLCRGCFPNEAEDLVRFGKNEGMGICVTGTRDWRDYVIEARLNVQLASRAGLLFRYQGLRRYLAVSKNQETLQLISQYHGEEVLDETPCRWGQEELHLVKAVLQGSKVQVFLDGEQVLTGKDTSLRCGGAGIFFEEGMLGVRDLKIGPS